MLKDEEGDVKGRDQVDWKVVVLEVEREVWKVEIGSVTGVGGL